MLQTSPRACHFSQLLLWSPSLKKLAACLLVLASAQTPVQGTEAVKSLKEKYLSGFQCAALVTQTSSQHRSCQHREVSDLRHKSTVHQVCSWVRV